MLKSHVADQLLNTRDYEGTYPVAELNVKFPYWMVQANHPNIKTIGDVSSISMPKGKILVVADTKDGTGRLEKLFGPAEGTLIGHRHSSVRTATFALPHLPPVVLKFPGKWVKSKGSTSKGRGLSLKDVERSQEAYSLLKGTGMVLPEPGGLEVFEGNGKRESLYTVQLRGTQFDMPVKIARSDRLVVLHSLLRAMAEPSLVKWLDGRKQRKIKQLKVSLIDRLSHMIITSVFEHGLHLEPHQQNVELVLGKELQIKNFWTKDLATTRVDLKIATALGLPAKDSVHLRARTNSTEDWYNDVWSTHNYEMPYYKFNRQFKRSLLAHFEKWLISKNSGHLLKHSKLLAQANQPLPPKGKPATLVWEQPPEVQKAWNEFVPASRFVNELRLFVLQNFGAAVK